MSDIILKLENIEKKYIMNEEEIRAVDGISLEVHAGEMVCIIGESGSGKSTLLNILGCIDLPDNGKYFLDNVNILKCSDNNIAEIRNKKIGFVFQQYNLINKLSAYENVELPLIYAGIVGKNRREYVTNIIKKVGMENRINHLPTQMSGGQQQRIAIARALVNSPSIILADEPTGNLDSKTSIEIMNLLYKINSEGKTIIIITHDLNIANNIGRKIFLKNGKIFKEEYVNEG